MDERHLRTLQRFYRRRRLALFTYALSITGDAGAAEDAIHTAFTKILQAEALPDMLQPYIYRAVRNEALIHQRPALGTLDR